MANLTLRRIRVYGTQDHYSSSLRKDTEGRPFVLEQCPSDGYRTSLYFGDIPEFALEADLARAAQANYSLNLVFGGVPEDEREPERGIRAEMAKLDPTTLPTRAAFNFYTTILIERDLDVELDASKMCALEAETLGATDKFLNVAVARLAIAQQRTFYKTQLMDRVFFILPGRSPLVMLQSSMTWDATITVDASSFPEEIARTLSELADPAYDTLSSPCYWYLESVRETDHFKAFLWAFFAMEGLVNALEKTFNALQSLRAEPTMKVRARAIMVAVGVPPKEVDFNINTPFLKLAAVAPELDPVLAESWLKEFKAVKSFRGKLAHANEAADNTLIEYRNRATSWLEGIFTAAIAGIRRKLVPSEN